MAAKKPLRQQIRYVKAADGTRLAWAQAGEGPVVVKAANWLSHLEYEWESPLWKHWLHFFAGNYRFVRYDERGCGMSEWRDSELSTRVWTDDLEAVIDAADPKEPVTLLGISQGSVASIGYALRHPERVSRLSARTLARSQVEPTRILIWPPTCPDMARHESATCSASGSSLSPKKTTFDPEPETSTTMPISIRC